MNRTNREFDEHILRHLSRWIYHWRGARCDSDEEDREQTLSHTFFRRPGPSPNDLRSRFKSCQWFPDRYLLKCYADEDLEFEKLLTKKKGKIIDLFLELIDKATKQNKHPLLIVEQHGENPNPLALSTKKGFRELIEDSEDSSGGYSWDSMDDVTIINYNIFKWSWLSIWCFPFYHLTEHCIPYNPDYEGTMNWQIKHSFQ